MNMTQNWKSIPVVTTWLISWLISVHACRPIKAIHTVIVVVLVQVYTDIKLDDCDKHVQTDCK